MIKLIKSNMFIVIGFILTYAIHLNDGIKSNMNFMFGYIIVVAFSAMVILLSKDEVGNYQSSSYIVLNRMSHYDTFVGMMLPVIYLGFINGLFKY